MNRSQHFMEATPLSLVYLANISHVDNTTKIVLLAKLHSNTILLCMQGIKRSYLNPAQIFLLQHFNSGIPFFVDIQKLWDKAIKHPSKLSKGKV